MRKLLALTALVFAGAAILLWMRPPLVVHSQALPPAVDGQQFRIVAGLKDREARTWKGSVRVSGGEILALEGWRFSPNDQASANGEFSFRTKIGLLENQLRPGEYFGQTGFEAQAYQRLIPQGLQVKLRGASAARVEFSSGAGSFGFHTADVSYGERVPFLDGNASVERLPLEQKLSDGDSANDQPAVAIGTDGKRWVAWESYRDKADEIRVSDGSQVFTVSGRGDLHAPAIAADASGGVRVVWPQRESGVFQLQSAEFREGQWSAPRPLTSGPGNNLWPRMASDGAGKMAVVWQGFRGDQSVILVREWSGANWAPERRASEGAGNCWSPAAAYGSGKLWIAWDSYATGAYQIYARAANGPVLRVTPGDLFSVRPSITVTASGQPVIAWEESDALWGKDFAYAVDRRGTVEYKNRRVRAAYLDSGEWKELAARIEEAFPPEIRRYIQQPQLAADANGHLYLTVRSRTSTRNSRIDYWANQGRWESFLTHLDGNRWAPVIPLPESVGRNGMRSAIAIDNGSVFAVWPTDARLWTNGNYGQLNIYATALPVSGNAARLDAGKPLAASEPASNPNPGETEDLRRIRAYRYKLQGKTYRILRGDFHRHTELSPDGAGDGMLEDNYRYTLDAAALDIGYVSDHQMGAGEEYNWWITQKSNDLYYMPQRFVPMYGYERSVPYPNGHRNVIWTERGKPVLKISPEEVRGEQNTGPILYPYLRETAGVATSHTTATEQGTDWRDNDPALEPVVEIYQGYDFNYEEPNAPRAWKPGLTQAHQAQRPAGFVWNAWAKGYKLGVQSSSDHISTHTSYACVLAEQFTRESILDAIRKRHTYAATDNIIVDFRIRNATGGGALMGDIVDSSAAPRLSVRMSGTSPIKQVDVIKNNKYVHQLKPGTKEIKFEYLDRAAEPGESYYYVRMEQTDGQLAWSSPIWVRYRTK